MNDWSIRQIARIRFSLQFRSQKFKISMSIFMLFYQRNRLSLPIDISMFPMNMQGMINDFSKLDFDSLWKGREKVSRIEKSIILEFLGKKRLNNVLEVGCGEGRLQEELAEISQKRFAVDLEPKFLEKVHSFDPRIVTVNSDLNSLPFRKGFFDAIVIVRVLNFLTDPYTSTSNLSLYLRSGGLLILSFYHYPSIAYVLDRLYPTSKTETSVSFRSKKPVKVRKSNFDEFFLRKSQIIKAAESNGLKLTFTSITGLGDYVPFKILSIPAIRTLERITSLFGFPPHTFLRFQSASTIKSVENSGNPFICQVCETNFARIPRENETETCDQCGSKLVNVKGIISFKTGGN